MFGAKCLISLISGDFPKSGKSPITEIQKPCISSLGDFPTLNIEGFLVFIKCVIVVTGCFLMPEKLTLWRHQFLQYEMRKASMIPKAQERVWGNFPAFQEIPPNW